ncbi:MAG: hypothetical protein OEZ38_08105 [Gammaproteobacteria bacterium]|nr:hypothetical protein [Gammaproteobacteria bacterium]
MLRLIKTSKQSTEELQRLWFSDDNHDLFAWLNNKNKPVRFQFTYNKLGIEHSFNWNIDTGFSHEKVDSGDNSSNRYKMTPILVPDGDIQRNKIADLFQSVSHDIDSELAQFIINKISNPSDT